MYCYVMFSFRTEVLNEFSDNLLKEVRDARKIWAFRVIQLAVNNACGNNRRATHILKKMRDFKYLTKKKVTTTAYTLLSNLVVTAM